MNEVLDALAERVENVPMRENLERMRRTYRHEPVDRLLYSPVPYGVPGLSSSKLDLPGYSFTDILESPEKMFIGTIAGFLSYLDLGADFRPVIGTLPGVTFIPAALGRPIRVMDSDMTPEQIKDEAEAEKLISEGVPDFSTGAVAQLIERIELFLEWMSAYPSIRDSFYITAPCCQGPFDNVHQMTGSKLFLWLVDRPDLVEGLLDLVTETHIQLQRYLESYFANRPYGSRVVFSQYCATGATNTRLVDDTSCNISPSMYDEFSGVYNTRIFDAFGGSGWMHYCGTLFHVTEKILGLAGIQGADMGGLSAEYGSRLEEFWEIASAKKVGLELLHVPPAAGRSYPEVRTMLDFLREKQIRTGVVLVTAVANLEMIDAYRKAWEETNEALFG